MSPNICQISTRIHRSREPQKTPEFYDTMTRAPIQSSLASEDSDHDPNQQCVIWYDPLHAHHESHCIHSSQNPQQPPQRRLNLTSDLATREHDQTTSETDSDEVVQARDTHNTKEWPVHRGLNFHHGPQHRHSSQDPQQPIERHLNLTSDLVNQNRNQTTPKTDDEDVTQASLKHVVTTTSEQ